ncbi:MAG: M23 family metallopeptidase [Chitinophagaceae bacterium]|nr:M23 family metallopeptidase [Chitinophagaceae bacterium]
MNRLLCLSCLFAGSLLFNACSTSGPSGLFGKKSPHEIYGDKITAAGLQETSLGKQWFSAAIQSLMSPLQITLPYKETGYFSANRPSAMGIIFTARRGQKIIVNLEKKPATGFALYLDFLQPSTPLSNKPRLLASADTLLSTLNYEIKNDGSYQLRLQPELLKGGEYTITITTGPSLAYPVAANAKSYIGSFWGVGRDNGTRKHEGIDIFAPKRTPLIAAAAGTVTRVIENNLGGKVIFLRPDGRDYSLYYAHLDEQISQPGQSVIVGDTIGLVGNTGNASTTSPHLHFGIYTSSGAVDPFPFIDQKINPPPKITANTDHLNKMARTKKEVGLYIGPSTSSTLFYRLPANTVEHIEAAASGWYKVVLPDGKYGFVEAEGVQLLTPLKSYELPEMVALFDAPDTLAPRMAELKPGEKVQLLGKFGSYSLVKKNENIQGWIKL